MTTDAGTTAGTQSQATGNEGNAAGNEGESGKQGGEGTVLGSGDTGGEGKGAEGKQGAGGDEGGKGEGEQGNKGGKFEGAPDSYDLKLPEHSLFDPKSLERTGDFARDLGLNQENAQKLVERDSKMLDAFVDHQEAAWAKTVESWAEAGKADPEIGGDKYEDTIAKADKAMRAFATEDFRKTLNESGYGNHPELLRVFAKIGATLTEDDLGGGDGGAGGKASDNLEDVLFPSMKQKQA